MTERNSRLRDAEAILLFSDFEECEEPRVVLVLIVAEWAWAGLLGVMEEQSLGGGAPIAYSCQLGVSFTS